MSDTAAAAARGVLGLVTIGQAPRTDLTPDILPLTAGLRLAEHGALDNDRFDGPDADAVRAAVGPVPGEAPLISRLRDGGSAVLGHEALSARMAAAVARSEADGADVTLLLCTGHFPPVSARRPLLYAEPLVQHAVRALVGADPIGIICPLPAQQEDVAARWARLLPGPVTAAPADPYGEAAAASCAAAARQLAADGARWLVLDCIGYTEEMRHAAARAAGLPVLLARTLAVRLAVEAALSAARARG